MAALALLRAIRQAGEAAFLRVLIQSVALAAASFVVLAFLAGWGLHHLLRRGVLADAAAVLGGAGSLLLALWLFLPVAAAIASLFLEPICRAVERRWYPGLPPAMGANMVSQMLDSLVLGGRLLVVTLLGLLATLALPGVGLILGWAIDGWAIGRGLFVAVAMRRMSRRDALSLYRVTRLSVLPNGVVLAVAGSLPLLNLLVPVIGTASMVHLVERSRASGRPVLEVVR